VEKLFEPFTQAHRNLRPDTGGCGLGLSICHRLATLMDGSISVSTQEGKGSVFTVQLLLPVQAHPSQKPVETKWAFPSVEPAELKAGKVLLVEDIAVNRMVATKFLNRLGLEVDIAEDGKQGVEAYRKGHYDWIFMDCQMPVMDGFEATREIKRLARAGLGPQNPVIIALTANAQPEDKEKCLRSGMDGFLEKPISMESLQQALQQVYVPPNPTVVTV
jgi:two-component system, sensor histidine kinase